MLETVHYLSVGSDNIATVTAWAGEPEKSAFVYRTVRPEHVASPSQADVEPVVAQRVEQVKADAPWPVASVTVNLGAYNPFHAARS